MAILTQQTNGTMQNVTKDELTCFLEVRILMNSYDFSVYLLCPPESKVKPILLNGLGRFNRDSNRPFHVFFFFSSFDKGQWTNIHLHCWKERLKIRKLTKCLLKFKGTQSREILQTFIWWGTRTCPPSVRLLTSPSQKLKKKMWKGLYFFLENSFYKSVYFLGRLWVVRLTICCILKIGKPGTVWKR